MRVRQVPVDGPIMRVFRAMSQSGVARDIRSAKPQNIYRYRKKERMRERDRRKRYPELCEFDCESKEFQETVRSVRLPAKGFARPERERVNKQHDED